MFTFLTRRQPLTIDAIRQRTTALGFDACSDERTGQLLAWLAGSKPGGRFLELGTGTGMSAAWLLMGMDPSSQLWSVDSDNNVQTIARQLLSGDQRAEFLLSDGAAFLQDAKPATFDFIFADAWPGKFSYLEETLELLASNGVYVIDDLFPQPNWPEDHQPNVDRLVAELERDSRLDCIRLDWSTGIMLARRR